MLAKRQYEEPWKEFYMTEEKINIQYAVRSDGFVLFDRVALDKAAFMSEDFGTVTSTCKSDPEDGEDTSYTESTNKNKVSVQKLLWHNRRH